MDRQISPDLRGTIVSVEVAPGAEVRAGTVLALVESMKLHHEVVAPDGATIASVLVEPGKAVVPGDPLFDLAPAGADARNAAGTRAASEPLARTSPTSSSLVRSSSTARW